MSVSWDRQLNGAAAFGIFDDFLVVVGPHAAEAKTERFALVIGNSAYQQVPNLRDHSEMALCPRLSRCL
ncbi:MULTISPECIES: hypothetical protein [unclassified Ruegeria]|uniref:hypothetical protein n=1 Tax=unclassified Ruegeria TaxID=2625375 RepID=UPI001492F63C|nr:MULTISPECIES: hypothetical protein [unclassified Ruegeria]NOC94503.1 hypothetical protein [Ruegeria sp. HKCCD6604]